MDRRQETSVLDSLKGNIMKNIGPIFDEFQEYFLEQGRHFPLIERDCH